MSQCIDVFYSPGQRAYSYVTFVIDENGAVITSRTHKDIGTVAEWCKRQNLPARTNTARIQTELRNHGVTVEAQPLKGGDLMTGINHNDAITITLPREQAHFLRQFLTTLREWAEGGVSASMIRYIFSAYSGWLDAFDKEMAHSIAHTRSTDRESQSQDDAPAEGLTNPVEQYREVGSADNTTPSTHTYIRDKS